MEATRAYANDPPVLLSTGLAGALALPGPDQIPLDPAVLDDPRRRWRGLGALDAVGVLRLHVRNPAGYAFLRPKLNKKFSDQYAGLNFSMTKAAVQTTYYRSRYHDYVPNDMLTSMVADSIRRELKEKPIDKRQGNAIAGVNVSEASGEHIVLFPSGQILQQACAFYSAEDGHHAGGFTSTNVETGAAIRQFAVMGRTNDYRPFGAEDIVVAARGATNCTILSVPAFANGDSKPTMQRKTALQFPEFLHHVAASPHVESELAFVSGDGVVQWWEPEGRIQTVKCDYSAPSEQIFRCEYSSHPRVLWAASRKAVATIDLRDPTFNSINQNKLFNAGKIVSSSTQIYDLKRRSRQPFQFISASGRAIQVFDSRMPRQALISWSQQVRPHVSQKPIELEFVAVEEVQMSSDSDEDRAAIALISNQTKTATMYPFERSAKMDSSSKALSLRPLLSSDEYVDLLDMAATHYIAADAHLDLRLDDGGEWTSLIGVCPIRANATGSVARVYQLNDLGDLLSHQIAWTTGEHTKSYQEAVQSELPAGVSAQDSNRSANPLKRKLPIPVDALLPEPPAESMANFRSMPVKLLLQGYPRLSENAEDGASPNSPTSYHTFQDEERIVERLHALCQPSSTLFRLHRYASETLDVKCSSRALLRLLRTRPEFTVESVRHGFRPKMFRVVNAPRAGVKNRLHKRNDDPRVSGCECSVQTALWPCESLSCVVPHALVVSSRTNGVRVKEAVPPSLRHPSLSQEYAQTIELAREAYGQVE